MMAALAPVEAAAAERAALPGERGDIDAELGEQAGAGRGDRQPVGLPAFESSSAQQVLVNLDSQLAGEMVVALACSMQRGIRRRAAQSRTAATEGDPEQRLERRSDFRAGEAEVLVASLALDGDQSGRA